MDVILSVSIVKGWEKGAMQKIQNVAAHIRVLEFHWKAYGFYNELGSAIGHSRLLNPKNFP